MLVDIVQHYREDAAGVHLWKWTTAGEVAFISVESDRSRELRPMLAARLGVPEHELQVREIDKRYT